MCLLIALDFDRVRDTPSVSIIPKPQRHVLPLTTHRDHRIPHSPACRTPPPTPLHNPSSTLPDGSRSVHLPRGGRCLSAGQMRGVRVWSLNALYLHLCCPLSHPASSLAPVPSSNNVRGTVSCMSLISVDKNSISQFHMLNLSPSLSGCALKSVPLSNAP
jgi:hypothetical protein